MINLTQNQSDIMVKEHNLLLIFYRNPELGKVKTRLAATIGEYKALDIYLKLATHSRDVTNDLDTDKLIFYSHTI